MTRLLEEAAMSFRFEGSSIERHDRWCEMERARSRALSSSAMP